jgi:mono/diheme cytochrome c family protein
MHMKRSPDSVGYPLTVLALAGALVSIATIRADEGQPQAAAAVSASSERPIDYNWDVRPILSDNCFRCHGPDEKGRQVNLRLDTAEGAYAALRRAGTHAIVPGKPDESQLIFRVTHQNAALRMPPRTTNKVLSPEQVEILRRWIAQGAEYKPHWAFVPPRKPVPPVVMASHRVVNDIDRFVSSRLEREGVRQSPEADKETLVNRVTLTLTGLPPTLADVDAYLKDSSPTAYEKLVDRLLASPAYGEHIASQWLDVARYAESDGFLDDLHDRLLWPYRDWVIASLNKNMPFDQFATWQLAGDLLPNATKEQKLATAFLRAGKRTNENGAIDEEYRVEYAVDRAVTIGTGFLAMTVGCARCHDHKYDPIPTKDFYSMTGFFNSTDEPGFYAPGRTGITAGPTLPWTDAATEKRIADAQAAIRKQDAAYQAARAQAARDAAGRADAILANAAEVGKTIQASLDRGLVGYYPLDEAAPVTDESQIPVPLPQARLSPPPLAPESLEEPCTSNNGPLVSDEACRKRFRAAAEAAPAERAGRTPARVLPGGLVREDLSVSPSTAGGARPAILMEAKLRDGVKGKAFFFTDNEMGVLGQGVGYYERTQPFSIDLWVRPGQVYEDSTVLHHRETENAGNAGYQLHLEKNRVRWEMMHSRAGNGISLLSKQALPINEWSHITVSYDGSSRAQGTKLYLNGVLAEVEVARDSLSRTIIPNGNANQADQALGLAFGKRLRAQTLKDGAIDEIRVFRTALAPAEVRALHNQVRPSAVPDPNRQDLIDVLAAADPRVERALVALVQARDVENEIVSVVPQVMVMGETPTPRPTYVLVRGNYEDHGEQVLPQGLSRVLPWNDAWPHNRIGLASWLFDAKNPLTARVFVNRAWQMHFGRGLVETAEDFGSQGSIPTHPELLDYLAVTFRESGWDIKRLHKLIAMSATYRQQSDASEDLLKKDPRNMLIARFTRIRMPAEMVRDQALAASGLLVQKIGGPSVYPYEPANMWDGFNVYRHPTAEAVPVDSHHRRTLYSFIKRNAPHPGMSSFDLPERWNTTARRHTSNTPLQALVLLDDPQYLSAYRSLAAHVMQAETAKDAQITMVFRLATRRRPRADELATLRAYHDAQIARFSEDRAAASKLLEIGVEPVDAKLDKVRLAALTNVTTVVMNTPDAYSLR